MITFAGEQRGQQAVHRRLPWVQRLRHRPERLLEPGRLGSRDTEGMGESPGVQPEQLSRRRGRAEMAEHAGDVPAAIGELSPEDAAEARLDLEAGDEGRQRLGAGQVPPLAERQHHGRDGRRAVDDGRQVRVVEIERVRLGAVGERGVERARAQAAPDHRGLREPAAGADHGGQRAGERLGRAPDRRAEPVGDRAARGLDHRRRQRRRLEPEREVHQRVHHRGRSVIHVLLERSSACADHAAVDAQHLAGDVAGAGEAKKRTAAATSSGRPSRPIGFAFSRRSICSG